MRNPHWTRWIIASLNTYFSSVIKGGGLDLYIEGVDRRTESERDYAELRIDGPFYDEVSKGYWRIDLTIDVLVVNKYNDQNIYTLESNLGLVLSAFPTDIPIFMYGDGPNDMPLVALGCLVLCPRPDEPVRVTNFGQIQSAVRMRQSSVEGCYQMFLTVP